MRDVPDQDHLEAGEAVVAEGAADKDPVLFAKFVDLDSVVENDGSSGKFK